MKKTLVMLLGIMLLCAIPLMASAATFTITDTQLASLYEVWENPGSSGTYLSPVQDLANGAKFTGNIRTSESGWGTIQIGANFWGTPFGGVAGADPTNVALGLGSLVGYDKFGLNFENVNENPWNYNVYFNVGYTGSGEDDYYVESGWTTIANGTSGSVILDLTNAHVWKNGVDLGWIDFTTVGANLAHISNIGFQIGATVPLPTEDYTFETKVTSVPEPMTLLLLGLGLVGVAGIRRKFKK